MGTVYRKTDKGQAEIATRQFQLPMKLRSALIMIDGKRTDEELLRMIPGQAQEVLQSLLTDGFIEVVAVTATPRASSSSSRAPSDSGPPSRSPGPNSVPPAPSRPIEQVRTQAVRFVVEQLGPLGDDIAIRMEKARSWQDLYPALGIAHKLLADNRGAATADAFKAAFLTPE
ncbi:MAG TPA: hypothetical protein VNO84_14535 [Burkholderiaceae bacterium]|nr:hypothetical protein [Burkholderiaceae bacterium]